MPVSVSWRTHVSTWLRFLVGNRLAPYHPMPAEAVSQVFRMVRPVSSDVLIDLGCGDGQLLLKACAQPYNVQQCIGYELNSELYHRCAEQICASQLQHRICVYNQNAIDADLASATIITLYLSVSGNKSLLPILLPKLQQHPQTRLISFLFPIPTLRPVSTMSVAGGIPVMLYNGQSIGG